MEVRIWSSFSCNNSSAYRLVARFSQSEDARSAASDFLAFLGEAGPLAGRTPHDATSTTFPATTAMDALATKHGFDWTALMIQTAYDDELMVVTEGSTLVAYHPYCLGLGKDLPAYFAARGGEVERVSAAVPTLSVTFSLTEKALPLRAELAAMFAQADQTKMIRQWPIKPPWSLANHIDGLSKDTAFFSTNKRLGFYIPIEPMDIERLKEHLEQGGAEDVTYRLCEYGDLAKFRAVGGARCSHCDGALELLDREEHDLETDQLACASCGGMFELESLV